MNRPFEVYEKDNTRLVFLSCLYGLLILILMGGLCWRQLILGDDYEQQEKVQSLRRILQPGPRGNIYDRNGQLIVGNRPVFYAAIYLAELRKEFRDEYLLRMKRAKELGQKLDREQVRKEARILIVQRYLNQVNRILHRNDRVNEKELDKHFRQRVLLPMPILSDLSADEYARLVDQLSVESPVQVLTDNSRFYPYRSLASHLLGYVSVTQEDPNMDLPGSDLTTFSFKGKVGRSGIEGAMNDYLQGISGGEIWLVDPVGFQYECVARKTPHQGKSVRLSIDIRLQQAAEKALGNHIGAAILLDVRTGEILAMASKPDYDLSRLTPFIPSDVYREISENSGWLNRALQGLYPPASPFKLVTTMTALRHQLIDPKLKLDCGPGMMIGNRFFKENNRYGHGLTDMEKAIAVSCNVYCYELSKRMQPEILAAEARRFGLDLPVKFELCTTDKMIVPDAQWKLKRVGDPWRPGDMANMAIGQGYLRLTPMNMVCFAASLARKQTRFQPTILYNPEHNPYPENSPPLDLSDDQINIILKGMQESARSGSSRHLKLPGIEVAAKTGTGQVKENGKKLTTPWVMGFAPVENPEIAFVVLIEGKKDDSLWGGTTAGPIARKILAAYFKDRMAGSSAE